MVCGAQSDGSASGVLPRAKKSSIMVLAENEAAAKEYFRPGGFKVSTRRRYIGGYLGESDEAQSFVSEKILTWVKSVETMATIAKSQPQALFAGFTHSLQHEWGYFQRVMELIEEKFTPLEEVIANTLLPSLFGVNTVGSKMRTITSLPVRKSGMEALGLSRDAGMNRETS